MNSTNSDHELYKGELLVFVTCSFHSPREVKSRTLGGKASKQRQQVTGPAPLGAWTIMPQRQMSYERHQRVTRLKGPGKPYAWAPLPSRTRTAEKGGNRKWAQTNKVQIPGADTRCFTTVSGLNMSTGSIMDVVSIRRWKSGKATLIFPRGKKDYFTWYGVNINSFNCHTLMICKTYLKTVHNETVIS